MFLPLIIEVTEYLKEQNVYIGKMINGNSVEFDPFVGCAIDYEQGKGSDLVGETFILWDFSVSKVNRNGVEFIILPSANGMTPIY